MGALHVVGAWLSVQLTGNSWAVTAVAQDSDLSPSHLLWYRRQQLSSAGVEVLVRNLTNSSQVKDMISLLRPSHVVYVPPGLEVEATPHNSAYWGSHMTGVVALLEELRSCANIVMISLGLGHDSHMTIQQAHMTSFEAVLLAYHSLYGTPYTVVRTGPVYGPWTNHSLHLLQLQRSVDSAGASLNSSWFINDVTDVISSALDHQPLCDHLDLTHPPGDCGNCDVYQLNLSSPRQPVERGLKKTLHWARAYQRQIELNRDSKNDVILTSYFTSREDFQRKKTMSPNRVRYMLEWLESVRDLGMRAVVFHDQLDPAFCLRVMQYHPGVSFVHVPPPLTRTTNDARFYSYLNHLRSQRDLSHVILTDISDVKFQRNPFELMRLLGNWLYIGTDIDFFPNMQSQRWISERLEGCFGSHTPSHAPLKPLMTQDTVFNAGVIGGSLHVILTLLELLVQYLDTTPTSLNCNMPAVNFVVHRYFHKQVFTGFPLTSRFLSFQSSPKGVYVVHK